LKLRRAQLSCSSTPRSKVQGKFCRSSYPEIYFENCSNPAESFLNILVHVLVHNGLSVEKGWEEFEAEVGIGQISPPLQFKYA
jgi:hypothetical protein